MSLSKNSNGFSETHLDSSTSSDDHDEHNAEVHRRRTLYNVKNAGAVHKVNVIKINSNGCVVVQLQDVNLKRLNRMRVFRRDLNESPANVTTERDESNLDLFVEPATEWYTFVLYIVDYPLGDGTSKWLRAKIVSLPSEDTVKVTTTEVEVNFVDWDRREMVAANRVYFILNRDIISEIPDLAMTVEIVGLKEAKFSSEQLFQMERHWVASESVFMITRSCRKTKRAHRFLIMLTSTGFPISLSPKSERVTTMRL